MKPRIFLIAAILLLALGSACGGGSRGKTQSQDASKMLAAAADAVAGVSSFHFKLTHEHGTTPLPFSFGLSLVSAEGDVVVPDKLSADVQAKAGPVNVGVKVVGVGDRTWVTNPFSRRWERQSGSVTSVTDPSALLTTLVNGVQGIRFVDQAAVGGQKTNHLAGKIDSGLLKQALETAEPGHSVDVDLWLDPADSLPRRARVSGPLSAGEAADIARQIDFSDYNESVEIKAPE